MRYKLLLAFVLVFPVWNLWSVAGSVSRGIMHIPTAVYDQDHSPASRRLLAMLRNSQHFDPDYYVSNQAELEQLLERGTVKVGLLIPQDFEAELSVGGAGTTAQVLLMILTGYYIFIELGWGLLISVVARTQGQGFLGAAFFVILEVILSGQVLPVEYMPRGAQVVSLLMPNRHYTTIVRGIMLKGSTLGDLWPQVVALGILGIILYALAANRLRKRLD